LPSLISQEKMTKRLIHLAILFYLFCPLPLFSQNPVTANFTVPDTLCANMPLAITNTSVGATSYNWTFCVSDINAVPVATNLGNVGGNLTGAIVRTGTVMLVR
jgi:hypothetical protein